MTGGGIEALRGEGRAARQREQLSEAAKARHPEPTFWQKVVIYSNLSFRYTLSDIRSRPRNTCIGIFAVFLVVFFSGLIITVTTKTPYMILRFAELQTGESDVMLMADGELPFINYTKYGPQVESASSVSGATPRWILKGQLVNWEEERRLLMRNESTASLPVVSANVLVINSEHEKYIGVGREWPLRSFGYGETQVFKNALRFIRLRDDVGDRLRMFIDLQGLIDNQNIDLGDMTTVSFNTNETGIDGDAVRRLVDRTNFTDVVLDNVSGTGENITISAAVVKGIAANVIDTALTSALNQTVAVNVLDIIPTSVKLSAAQKIDKPDGKYASLLGNVALLDDRHLLEMVGDQAGFNNAASGESIRKALGPLGEDFPDVTGAVQSAMGGFLNSISLRDYAFMIVALFKDRYNIYYSSSKQRAKKLIRASNALMLAMGTEFDGSVSFTLASYLDTFELFQLFIDSVFITIVAVIIILGSILVYMLLITNAEERQFEVAIIRSLGMAKGQLVHLMVTQAAAFVLPGLVLGIGFLLLANAIIEWILADFTKAPASPMRISTPGIIVACCVGFVMPIIANYRPATAALATSLREALSMYRQKGNETTVTMVRLEEMGLEPWQVLLGLFLTIAGFMVYYLVPMSFVYSDLFMFFLLMDMVVLTMLMGLCLLTYTVQGLLQKVLLFGMLRPFEWHLWTLVTRNLKSHKERNALTFMMFNISVSCIVFAGVLFTMLSNTLVDTVMLTNGADVTITSTSYSFPLDKAAISAYLSTQGHFVEAFSFSTFSLRDAAQTAGSEEFGSVVTSGGRRRNIRTVGVDENFQDAVFEKFMMFSEVDGQYGYSSAHGKKDVVRNLYSNPASSVGTSVGITYTGFPLNYSEPDVDAKYKVVLPCIMPSGVKEVLGLRAGSSGVMSYYYSTKGRGRVTSLYLIQPRALAEKLSGFVGVSSRQFSVSSGNVIISVPAYRELLRSNSTDFGTHPSEETSLASNADWTERYERCYMRLRKGISDDDRSDFVNALQSKVNPYHHTPADTKELVDSVKSISNLIMYFFFFVGACAIALDAVMLWLAFVSNVRSQAWAFGVLRSLGFRVWQLVRAYLYESLVVTLSAFITGTVIGIVVAYALILQMSLFLDMPVEFAFPYALYFVLLGLSLLASVAGSIFPVLSISKKAIASVIKGV